MVPRFVYESGALWWARMIAIPETAAPPSVVRRMASALFGQLGRSLRCPPTPRLDGKLAVVTGATGGIGLEIARGLAGRGAELILPCRNPAKGERVAHQLRTTADFHQPVHLAPIDLEDLDSVRAGAKAIADAAAGRQVDVLVENAGIWPQRYGQTRQGFEIAFGVNLLAHFVLRQELQRRGLLDTARVIVVTGDIYIIESDCTSDHRWNGGLGGMRAYCRSKLGNIWIAAELTRRFPKLCVFVAHPGVVATNLGGNAGALGDRIKARFMIPPELGAQTALVCATQEGLENGGYYHNTGGLMRLAPSDPARDTASSKALWDHCEALAAG